MTRYTITQAGTFELAGTSRASGGEPGGKRSVRSLVLTAALVLALTGVATFLVLAFTPLTSAVGGCGGG
jgi:hypothetical protein